MVFSSKHVLAIVPLLVLCGGLTVYAQESQPNGDVDEGSCICGINTQLINKLEAIFQTASNLCVSPSSQSIITDATHAETGPANNVELATNSREPGETRPLGISTPTSAQTAISNPFGNETTNADVASDPSNSSTSDDSTTTSNEQTPAIAPDLTSLQNLLSQQGYNTDLIGQIMSQLNGIQSSTTQSSSLSSGVEASDQQTTEAPATSNQPSVADNSISTDTNGNSQQVSTDFNTVQMILQLSAEIQKLQAQLNLQPPGSPSSASSQSDSTTSRPAATFIASQTPAASQSSLQSGPTATPFTLAQSNQFSVSPIPVPTFGSNHHQFSYLPTASNGFLGGLPTVSTNDALIKLNQSQTVQPQVMANALESTVPNVVSNIFSDIQDLTSHQGEQPGERDETSQLTSIDGSSVNLTGDTADQITESGERLFALWIEHQLESLHLTASTANYIRKSAMNLFKRIASQYVERASNLGGSVERNVQQATQKALTNTQNLIAFILRNYLNFAGGFMQIIGEQVSRVGKQLDSTGDTIAHINLNPFDIVSNVMESLPNPSDYARYFRTFGKQLMGELSSSSSSQASSESGSDQQQAQTPPADQAGSSANNPAKSHGLLSKTMKSLGKTMSSWMG